MHMPYGLSRVWSYVDTYIEPSDRGVERAQQPGVVQRGRPERGSELCGELEHIGAVQAWDD
jgi:hypothetical protein